MMRWKFLHKYTIMVFRRKAGCGVGGLGLSNNAYIITSVLEFITMKLELD